MEPPPGVVFDCTVFLQALANRKGPAFACKQLLDEGRIVLFVSEQVLAEVTEVLNRPELHRKLRALTPERVAMFLADVTAKARTIAEPMHFFSYPRDPKDEPYINLALAAGARYLVAWDRDMLALMEEERLEGKEFRKCFPGLTILNPPSFLDVMRETVPQT